MSDNLELWLRGHESLPGNVLSADSGAVTDSRDHRARIPGAGSHEGSCRECSVSQLPVAPNATLANRQDAVPACKTPQQFPEDSFRPCRDLFHGVSTYGVHSKLDESRVGSNRYNRSSRPHSSNVAVTCAYDHSAAGGRAKLVPPSPRAGHFTSLYGAAKVAVDAQTLQRTTQSRQAYGANKPDRDCEQGSLQSSQCPGICEKLRTCEACTVLGRGVQMATPSVAEATQVSPCQWWGPRQMCYSIGNMYRRRHSTLAWWGNQTTLTSLQQCRTKDQWSGLTKLQYRHPANYSQPDYVENIPESQLEFKQSSEPGGAPKRELLIGKYFTIMLRGFIHTSALSLSDRYDHSVWVYSSYTNVIVNISANAAVQETVSRTGANRTESMFWQQAHHMSGLAVLPGGSRDNKLYLSLLASQQIHEDQHPSMVKLAWGSNRKVRTGLCVDGDFAAPYSDVKCPHAVNARHELRATAAAEWSYGTCPDVDECGLLLHDCHDNATCVNTLDSYACRCDRGFVGNGRDVCNKTCYDECVHGVCSGAPLYECSCHLGWTGANCTVNCGCHNHSVCPQGLGICDNCEEQTWTEGEHCEFCREGSFGNATSGGGCVECRCNGHGNASLGVCDSATGNCYCVDNTERCCIADVISCCALQETVSRTGANRTESMFWQQAHHMSGLAVLPGGSRDNKLYLSLLASQQIHEDQHPSMVKLAWGSNRKVFERLALQPWAGEPSQCMLYANCLVCIADGSCGWCHSTRSCVAREGAAVCMVGDEESHLVYIVSECPLCSDHVNCRACVENGECEWLLKTNVTNVSCVRRGRFDVATRDAARCSLPCSHYDSCAACTSLRNECAWCESTRTCFPFHTYLASYGFENCRHARSGYLTVYATENWNLTRQRFTAIFQIHACPGSCSGNWECKPDGSCGCRDGFGGPDCETEHCPGNCSWRLHQGFCDHMLNRCVCDEGFSGGACDVATAPHHAAFTPLRAAAAAARYCVTVTVTIPPRIWGDGLPHGYRDDDVPCVSLQTEFVLGEGIGDKTQSTLGSVPPLAGHTLTYVGDSTLVLLGGYAAADPGPGGFSGRVYRCVMPAPVRQRWSRLQTHGVAPIGLYGHSAVYHPPSGALYVFGGYEYYINRTSISAKLYALDLLTLAWQLLAPIGSVPVPRFFHAAVTTNDFMLVAGGRTAKREFDNVLVIYRCRIIYALHIPTLMP
ncbi:PREDICTED: multiple epidermal growth factor-like domains protein 8 [Priapulus caudatus]|uniref:Multiple epidermal growth factor-like domains protein 8 n=1 Tax=Priapulus caudatus TaxID=37621 RepID=A0ABM1DR95_PRICU|nr:PREDICTED: multiple epidermal growth factor-like domains protein 8 [Priapulus caudatus]